MPRQYSPEFRQRALRLLNEATPDYESEFEAIRQVASKLGISTEALRRWRRSSEVDAGDRPEMTTLEHAELKRLKRENADLRRWNYMSLVYTDRIVELGATPSTGTVGDSYDCQSVLAGIVMVPEVLAVPA